MFSFFGGGEIRKEANHRRNLSVETSGVDLISSEEQLFDKLGYHRDISRYLGQTVLRKLGMRRNQSRRFFFFLSKRRVNQSADAFMIRTD